MTQLKQYFSQEDINTSELESETVNVAEPEVAAIVPAENVEEDVAQAPEVMVPVATVATEDVEDHYTPLTSDALQVLLDARPHPEATLGMADLQQRITATRFTALNPAGTTIACTLTLDNGMEVIGYAQVLDARNHNVELGKHFAHRKALEQLVPVAVYLHYEGQRSAPPVEAPQEAVAVVSTETGSETQETE